MDKVYRLIETRKLVLYGIIVFGIAETGLIRFAFPASYTNYLLLVPAYFLLLGVCVLILLARMKRKRLHPGRAVARLMLFNISQMLLSFIVIFIYAYFVEDHRNVMLLAFFAFYVFFMGIKFFIIYNIDNQHKTEKKRLQNAENKQ